MPKTVVDRLQMIEIDLQQAVGHPRSADVRPDIAQILVEPSPVASAGQRVDPCRELQRLVDSFELDHVGGGMPAQAPNVCSRSPGQDERDQAWQHQEVADRLDGEAGTNAPVTAVETATPSMTSRQIPRVVCPDGPGKAGRTSSDGPRVESSTPVERPDREQDPERRKDQDRRRRDRGVEVATLELAVHDER